MSRASRSGPTTTWSNPSRARDARPRPRAHRALAPAPAGRARDLSSPRGARRASARWPTPRRSSSGRRTGPARATTSTPPGSASPADRSRCRWAKAGARPSTPTIVSACSGPSAPPAAREPSTKEYRVQHEGGGYRWVLDHGLPRRGEGGAFLGYIGTCTDIDDRKRAEEMQGEADRRKDEFLAMLGARAAQPARAHAHWRCTLIRMQPSAAPIERHAQILERQVAPPGPPRRRSARRVARDPRQDPAAHASGSTLVARSSPRPRDRRAR